MQKMIILPGDPLFDLTLGTLPPDWKEHRGKADHFAFVVRPGSGGLLEPVFNTDLDEYLEDGEFEARSQELEDEWD